MGKTQRKDKGKRRFTAYMLWAKETRRQFNPYSDLDFGNVSKRLGEMWANVPSNQKFNWKRRARRIANKFKQSSEKALSAPFVKRYLHLGESTTAPSNNPAPSASTASPGSTARSKKTQKATNMISTDTKPIVAANVPVPESPTKGGGHQKLPGYQPTDVAAHLKLLGDSLTIIGERLKEHEVVECN